MAAPLHRLHTYRPPSPPVSLRHLPFYAAERGPNVRALRRILLTYAMYNFNLRYCQVRFTLHAAIQVMCTADGLSLSWSPMLRPGSKELGSDHTPLL